MIIKDMMMFLPNTMMSLLKVVRTDIDDIAKQEILKNGLYHITKDEETAEKIIQSEHLRPATGITKNINSYGKACVYLFNGIPSVDNYMKNLCQSEKSNPYINPTIVSNAIKISLQKKEELNNYKVRALVDNAIIYEGYCVLPKEETKAVYLVPDLVRNSETGEPIINQKTGKYDIEFREAKIEELEEDRKNYKAKEDYLQFMAKESERLGYIKQHNFITNPINSFLTMLHLGRIEGEMTYKNTKLNLPQIIKAKIKQLLTPKLDMGSDEKIHNIFNEFSTKNKNPYRDQKFGESVANFQRQGLTQLELKDELKELTTSNTGKYFRQKYNQIDKSSIISKGKHGIEHNNRVAIHSMIIAQKEGILDNDLNNKTKDLLLSAAYYHDIGRKKGIIVDNYGSHSKNSARKIGKKDLEYLNGQPYSMEDKKMLQAIIQAHEGKDKDMLKICKKYKIQEENIDYTIKLMEILKDADALDRVRLDLNLPISMKTDLNPQYLRTNTSKQLLNASYQLESLTKKVSFENILAYKTDEQQSIPTTKSKRDIFVNELKKGIIEVPRKVKKMLKLSRENNISNTYSGKLQQYIVNRRKEQMFTHGEEQER